MPDLEMLLRDVRPAPDPAWAARLDARAAAGFPGPVPPWKAKLRALRDHMAALSLATATAGTLMLILIVGVKSVGGGDSASETSSGGASSASAPASRSGKDSAGAVPETQSPAPEQPQSASRDARSRAVISSAAITLSTAPGQVEIVTDRAIRLVDTLGGYVQSSQINREGSNATASLVVKIPSARLDSGLAQISKLAHVKSRSQQAEDVTDQRSALEAAVRDARADRDGLRTRLSKATTDKERSRLRAQLDRATRRVTQRERRVAELGQAVSYATVDLSVEGTRKSGAAVPGDRWTPGDAIKDAGRVLEVIAGVFLIGLAILLPLAILAGLGVVAGRGVTHRRRERALEAS
jgi:hypothetical protein